MIYFRNYFGYFFGIRIRRNQNIQFIKTGKGNNGIDGFNTFLKNNLNAIYHFEHNNTIIFFYFIEIRLILLYNIFIYN